MTRFQTTRVPQLAWYGDDELELPFPASWEVTTYYMRGASSPPLSREQMKQAFARPIGTEPLRELARGRKEVAIIFDDMTRPTRAAGLLPFVLAELGEAGVPDGNIRLISAIGGHGALNRLDFAKKLGEDIPGRFPIYNHNPWENCTFVGRTLRGTPVWVNSEVMACDLKIGIGCILPHTLAGFGGGGKIILPGVSSVETILANHALAERAPETIDYGKIEGNELRADIDEASRLAGLDLKIDVIVNTKREAIGLFLGEPAAAHRQGVRLAKEVYATEGGEGADVVVANLFAKADEAGLFLCPASRLLKERGGVMVLIANTPVGQVTHYLLRSFGKNIGGRRWHPRTSIPPRVNRLIFLSSYPDRAAADWLAPPDSIFWARSWGEALDELRAVYDGQPRVTVIPDVTMQYFPALIKSS